MHLTTQVTYIIYTKPRILPLDLQQDHKQKKNQLKMKMEWRHFTCALCLVLLWRIRWTCRPLPSGVSGAWPGHFQHLNRVLSLPTRHIAGTFGVQIESTQSHHQSASEIRCLLSMSEKKSYLAERTDGKRLLGLLLSTAISVVCAEVLSDFSLFNKDT